MIKIPLSKPYFDDDELREIREALDSGLVTQGPKVKEFEEKIAERLDAKYAVSLSSCTTALHLALLSIGVRSGDEVLVADFTYPATAHAVLYCGAKPVFVDIDPQTYNIDPELIAAKISRRTKAIIPVHTFGQPAEMDCIIKIARAKGVKVIEDAACAFGATYKGRYAGTLGDIGCFSFHGRKGITTGEGGAIVTNNKTLAEKVRRLSMFGAKAAPRKSPYQFIIPEFVGLGYNYKLSDIAAACGIAQLRKLSRIIERKEELAQYWNKRLGDIAHISVPYKDSNARHIYQGYVTLVDKKIDRNKLIERLLRKGIQTQVGTYACHMQPVYRSHGVCPNSLDVFRRSLALPLYYALNKSDIDRAASCIKKVLEELS